MTEWASRFGSGGDRLFDLISLVTGVTVAALVPLTPLLGLDRGWLLYPLVILPLLALAVALQRRGQPGWARLVLLAACDFGLVHSHLRLGSEAYLSLGATLILVACFPLFRGLPRPPFRVAVLAQALVLLAVMLLDGPADGGGLDPAQIKWLGRLSVALDVPLLVALLRELWRMFEASEQQAIASQDRWDQLLSSAPVDVLVVSADGLIESSNRPERPDLAPGQPLASVLGGYDPSRLLMGLSQSEGTADAGVVLAGCGPGGDLRLRVGARALLKGRCLVTLEDVTERQVERARLREAQEEIALAERSRARLMGRLAHELRTPLTLVLGHTEELRDRDEPLAPGVAAGLDEIHASARHLRRRIDDLLQAARAPGDGLSLEPRDVQLPDLLARALSEWEGPASVREVRLHHEVSDDAELVSVDPGALRRILWHLLSNAVRFAPGGTVLLAARREEAELVVTVEDDGIGVPEGLHERMVAPFRSGPHEVNGLGLGLATSRQRAQRMGGDLRLSPRAGGGTIATVTLPWEDPIGSPNAALSLSDPAPLPRRALVVDDVLLNAEIAAALLDEEGYEAIVFTDPQAALDAARAERFDLALVDCHMPVLSGYALAEALRDDPGDSPAFPLVALTVDDSLDCAQRCRTVGFERRLLKPLRPETLNAALASLSPGPAAPRSRVADHLLETLLDEFGPGRFLAELVEKWLTSTQEHREALASAVEGGDRVGLEQAAHAMTSPARTLGALELAARASELETAAPSGDWSGLEARVRDLVTESESVAARLRRRMGDAA